MKFGWIQEHATAYPITVLCGVLGVSAGGYHRWKSAEPSKRQRYRQAIDAAVAEVFADSWGIYGRRKIFEELRERPGGVRPSCNAIGDSMRRQGLRSRACKARRPRTTISNPRHRKPQNLLARDFTAEAPNTRWVTDITYISVAGRWSYLATVTDLFSRRIVGWSVAEHMRVSLVIDAMRDAVEARRPRCTIRHEGVRLGSGLLLHSDRGSQYTSEEFRSMLEVLGVTQSMSDVGRCHDNAVAESVFGSVKTEWTNHEVYESLSELRSSLRVYFEWFNRKRRHQTLGYRSPAAFESAWRQRAADPSSASPAGTVSAAVT